MTTAMRGSVVCMMKEEEEGRGQRGGREGYL
jgi:hypothetical protein